MRKHINTPAQARVDVTTLTARFASQPPDPPRQHAFKSPACFPDLCVSQVPAVQRGPRSWRNCHSRRHELGAEGWAGERGIQIAIKLHEARLDQLAISSLLFHPKCLADRGLVARVGPCHV